MATDGSKHIVTSLLVVEGDTEEIFYQKIKKLFFPKLRIKIRNAHGRFNILKVALLYAATHKKEKTRICCCLDSECPYGTIPDFDIDNIKKAFREEKHINTLSINSIFASPMIESWFFYDLSGIYDYLEVPRDQRRPQRKFQYPQKCKKSDLQKLFKDRNGYYNKSSKAKSLINRLDVMKIATVCPELHDGIELIKSQARDLTNHLFSRKK